jgi:hypothetical protein
VVIILNHVIRLGRLIGKAGSVIIFGDLLGTCGVGMSMHLGSLHLFVVNRVLMTIPECVILNMVSSGSWLLPLFGLHLVVVKVVLVTMLGCVILNMVSGGNWPLLLFDFVRSLCYAVVTSGILKVSTLLNRFVMVSKVTIMGGVLHLLQHVVDIPLQGGLSEVLLHRRLVVRLQDVVVDMAVLVAIVRALVGWRLVVCLQGAVVDMAVLIAIVR